MVYDITLRDSFNHLTQWMNDCKQLTTPQTKIALIGNKLDLSDERQVSYEEANKFAQDNKILYLEVSAKTGKNIEECFMQTANKIYQDVKSGIIDKNEVATSDEKTHESNDGCNC